MGLVASARIDTSGPLLKGQAPEIVQRHIDALVQELTLLLQREVKTRTPQGVFGAQGGLLGSIQAEVTGRGTPLIKGLVASAHAYAETIEKGRRPGGKMPPPGVLVRWIEQKFGVDGDTAQRLEFVVRRKIARAGFDGAKMFERAFVESQNLMQQRAAARGLSITRELDRG
ncbi:hypothetical protein [Geoalkalibacter sp.]|uniref:hypothetical protein n=1 Tax=Geoalkalibacter sp. TaxID=3041440 RepID=UPI00272EA8A8|nr:hypothetical protein [Geoalkalibacter sp.]